VYRLWWGHRALFTPRHGRENQPLLGLGRRDEKMFLKAKEMQAWIIIAQSMGIETIGEAIALFKTLQALKAHGRQ